jgi:hypothetical protein
MGTPYLILAGGYALIYRGRSPRVELTGDGVADPSVGYNRSYLISTARSAHNQNTSTSYIGVYHI